MSTKQPKFNKPNPIDDPLQDCHFQRGIMWRRDMICAIVSERLKKKTPDSIILKRLRRGGITLQKATELMNEATELYGEEE